jgi:predicted acyl esterase
MRRSRALVALSFVLATLAAPLGARAQTNRLTYATMSDGIKIALAVGYPDGFDAERSYPALFVMDGYDGGAGAYSTATWGRNRYVTIHASVRGTGCSGGKFNLFDRRSAFDGYEIIENWIVKQSWSNGRVGIIGHSYPGLTGFLVAATSPPHVKAIAISGLIDDLYRGIVYPGGVPNYGFPSVWTGAYRPASELSGNASRYQSETSSGDPTCATNIATRPPGDPLDNPIANGLNTQDSQWWASHALLTYINGIKAPIDITQQWQDEQTGPRGGNVLWEKLPSWLPKRLQLTNGVHATNSIANRDKNDWLDCWIIARAHDDDADCGNDQWGYPVDGYSSRVQVHFETQPGKVNAPVVGSDWPLPQTAWTRMYLHPNGTLSDTAGAGEASSLYVSPPGGRQTPADAGGLNPQGGAAGSYTYVEGPDELSFSYSRPDTWAVAGPSVLRLRASSTAPDTDFFVDVLDRTTATGELQYLQRGMQRASHMAIDVTHSDYVKHGPARGELYRAYEPHTNPQLIVPGQDYNYDIEIFPVGHVFRPGHELVVKLHAPPPADPLSIYAWVSAQPPAVNTVAMNGLSSLFLPIVGIDAANIAATPPACGAQAGVPCFKPVA